MTGTPEKMRVSVIGAGAMGGGMAGVLLDAGVAVTVYDLNPRVCREMAARGAAIAGSPVEAAQTSEAVLFSLPHEDALQADMEMILQAGLGDRLFLDTTTCSPAAAERLAPRVAEQGGWFLDTPVKGGVTNAGRGTLSILVGGTTEAFTRASPLLSLIGSEKKIIHVGANGHGHAAKLVNQTMQGIEHWGITEIFALTARLGADPRCILDHLLAKPGLEGGRLSRFAHGVMERQYGEARYVAMMGKDLRCFLALADVAGTVAPLARATAALYAEAIAVGETAQRDFNAVSYHEERFGGPLEPASDTTPRFSCEEAIRVAAAMLEGLYVAEVSEIYAAVRHYGADLRIIHRCQFGADEPTGVRDGTAGRIVSGGFTRDAGVGRLAAELNRAAGAAQSVGADTPLLDVCAGQFAEAARRCYTAHEPAALIHLWEDARTS